jgi:transposase InsO family protein
MLSPLDKVVAFRLSVLGVLASRKPFRQGELKSLVQVMSQYEYTDAHNQKVRISPSTISRWHYAYRHHGIEGLIPKARSKKGTRLPLDLQEKLLNIKKTHPYLSIHAIIKHLEANDVASDVLYKSTVYRFFKHHGLTKLPSNSSNDLMAFASSSAQHCGAIYQSDITTGPLLKTPEGLISTYLISWLDDCSRYIVHAKLYLSDQIHHILCSLQATLVDHGRPHKLIIDNARTYHNHHLQRIGQELDITLMHHRPGHPQSKGKVERWQKSIKSQLFARLNQQPYSDLNALNKEVQSWLAEHYHNQAHPALSGDTPKHRWIAGREDLRDLGLSKQELSAYFALYEKRSVKVDGSFRYNHQKYITDTSLARQKVWVVLDIQTQQPIAVTHIGGTKRFAIQACEPVQLLVPRKKDMRRHMYVQSLINQTS